ncbi:tRNA (N(6)-L-threonylcarbamoyladenosine(37)-C(2))-methylthiotransferase MtaB [bacterium]|nr:tRNA (N(6)-L-threonylcarbamoyladenosine(37)-C(2))-methylthiotransferase MtaB [bacterium]
MLSVAIQTLGCKLNQAESAMLAQDFIDRGYIVIESGEDADVSVINTCTVTARSDSKCRQAIRKCIRANPEATIIVAGCYPQISTDAIAEIPGVDYILGVQEKLQVFKYFPGPGKLNTPVVAVSPVNHVQCVQDHGIGYYGSQTRAVLKVQSGCDNDCTYCIVPTVRGPSRSVPVETVLKQTRQLVQQGYKEIVITGIHVGEYGKDLPGQSSLPDLLNAMVKVEGLLRIRLTSLEPHHVSDNLLRIMADYHTICRHFHLSIQSGSPEILAAMKRKSSQITIKNAIQKILHAFPDAGLGTDIIAGFPGETDSHFQETRELLESMPFSYFHVFPFSSRPGTLAAALPNQVPVRDRMERVKNLRELGKEKSKMFRKQWMGRTADVLLESRNRQGSMSGWTSQYIRVEVGFDPKLVNCVVPVQLETLTDKGIRGKVSAV